MSTTANSLEKRIGALAKPGPSPLRVNLYRGPSVESQHHVHAVLCDSKGHVLKAWGDPDFLHFPRSAVKPLQALAYLSEGLHEKFQLSDSQIALSCASHHGEPVQVKMVEDWLKSLELSENHLICGAHEPNHKNSAIALYESGKRPCALHNNCSGKHSSLLMGCKHFGFSVEKYYEYEHPWQVRMRKVQAEFFAQDFSTLSWGIDGCGIPTYATSLKSLAMAFARFASGENIPAAFLPGINIVRRAFWKESYYVGGSESLCSALNQAGQGRFLAKLGAEGVYAASDFEAGLGLAVKAECGTPRAAEAAVVTLLESMGLEITAGLEKWKNPLQKRWNGDFVGQILVE